MGLFIPHQCLNVIIFLLISASTLAADPYRDIRQITLKLPTGQSLETRLAITVAEQNRGLSGVPDKAFGPHQGMLFFYLDERMRSFWMPDTYFDLAIVFLDAKLTVKAVEFLPHHPGRKNPRRIPRTRPVHCRHVLELRADSPLARTIKVGTRLSLSSALSLGQIESKIRRGR